MNRRERFQIELLNWFSAMVGAGKAMPQAEMRELLQWEAENLGGGAVGTSDWPGWKTYVGEMPVISDEDIAKDRFGYVYLVRAQSGEYKLGRSSDVKARMRNFATLAPFEFDLIHKFPADDCRKAEGILHKRFSEKRIKREWFDLDQPDVSTICELSGFVNGNFVRKQPQ